LYAEQNIRGLTISSEAAKWSHQLEPTPRRTSITRDYLPLPPQFLRGSEAMGPGSYVSNDGERGYSRWSDAKPSANPHVHKSGGEAAVMDIHRCGPLGPIRLGL
jgi:hypothetical protein